MLKRSLPVFLTLGVLFFLACKSTPTPVDPQGNLVSSFDNTVAVAWNDAFLQTERYAAGYRPGPAPRALALLGLSAYEACVSAMPEYQSVASLYPGLAIPKPDASVQYHWPSVINGSYAYLTNLFFINVAADKRSVLGTTENSQDDKFKAEVGEATWKASKDYGVAVAKAVWEWSKGDTYGHDAYLDPFGTYDWQAHYKGPGDWRPTTPGPGKPMFPNWGKARTFAISEADKLCPPPLPFSESPNSPLYAQAVEVYAATTGANYTYENQWIAEFWSDDLVGLTFSPGPRWIAIANQVYIGTGCSLEKAVVTNVKVGMALCDASIACWYSKYVYNIERPATYINRIIDPNWTARLNNPQNNDKGITPSFPAYPSGHSTMGGAGAEVLTYEFGSDYAMTDICHKDRSEFRGTPRAFNSFYEMAEENAISRVPLGVHFRMDCEVGVNLGYRCGRKVNHMPWKK